MRRIGSKIALLHEKVKKMKLKQKKQPLEQLKIIPDFRID